MNVKLEIYEKINSIIDEEILKTKNIIMQRCNFLFDELLSKHINKSFINEFNDNDPTEKIKILNEDISSLIIKEEHNNNNDDDEISVYETEILGNSYYISDDEPCFIFEKLENENVGDCIGVIQNEHHYLFTTHEGNKVYMCVETGNFHKYIDDENVGNEI